MKKTISIIGMVSGIAIIILGLVLAFGFNHACGGSYAESFTFGADFYTEQYSATARAANNVRNLGVYLEYAVEYGFLIGGLITSAVGLAVTCYFNGKYIDAKNPPAPIVIKQEEKNVSSELPEI